MNSESLLEKAYKEIRYKILHLDYSQGSLLSIYKLAKELGMSRTPIAHAIVRLEADGLVVSFKNRGIMIREIQTKECIDNFELMHCYRTYTLKLVQASDDHAFQLDQLELHLKQIEEEKENDNYYEYLIATLDFMKTLLAATNNYVMLKTFDSIRDIIILSSYTSYKNYPHLEYYSGANFYATLYRYLKNEEYEEATQSMEEHYLKVRQRILMSGVINM